LLVHGGGYQMIPPKRALVPRTPCFFLWKLAGRPFQRAQTLRPASAWLPGAASGLLRAESSACCRRWSTLDLDAIGRWSSKCWPSRYSQLVADWNGG
jgi:hypothetical protein